MKRGLLCAVKSKNITCTLQSSSKDPTSTVAPEEDDGTKLIDGFPHEYDQAKQAWFPLISQTTLEAQSSIYGTSETPDTLTRKQKRKAEEAPAASTLGPRNTAVFVQGLDLDTRNQKSARISVNACLVCV
jgi:hypothetical protein